MTAPRELPIEPSDGALSGGVIAAMQPRLDQDRIVSTMRPASQSERPQSPQYEFNPPLALAIVATIAFVWFARRRLKWLAQRVFSNLVEFIRWLHMPPDGKI